MEKTRFFRKFCAGNVKKTGNSLCKLPESASVAHFFSKKVTFFAILHTEIPRGFRAENPLGGGVPREGGVEMGSFLKNGQFSNI